MTRWESQPVQEGQTGSSAQPGYHLQVPEDTWDVITSLETMASVTEQKKGMINHIVSLVHPAGSLLSQSLVNQGLNFEILPLPSPHPCICRAASFWMEGGSPVRAFHLPGHLPFCSPPLLPASLLSTSHGRGLTSRLIGCLG